MLNDVYAFFYLFSYLSLTLSVESRREYVHLELNACAFFFSEIGLYNR